MTVLRCPGTAGRGVVKRGSGADVATGVRAVASAALSTGAQSAQQTVLHITGTTVATATAEATAAFNQWCAA